MDTLKTTKKEKKLNGDKKKDGDGGEPGGKLITTSNLHLYSSMIIIKISMILLKPSAPPSSYKTSPLQYLYPSTPHTFQSPQFSHPQP